MESKVQKIRKVFFFLGAFFLLMFTATQAATWYSTFSLSIPGYNGSAATGFGQTKSIGGANGNVEIYNIPGDHRVDIRMEDEQGTNGAWLRQITTGETGTLPGNSNQLPGDLMRMRISTNWNTPGISANGVWRSY